MSEKTASGAALSARLGLLCVSMRAAGARVGVGELLAAHRALGAIDATDRRACFFALRAVLCSGQDDLHAFQAAFAEVFGRDVEIPPPPEELDQARLVLPRAAVAPEPGAGRPVVPEDPDIVPAAWSDVELLGEKDFAEYTDCERAAARRILRRLAAHGPMRPSRRTRASHRRGSRPSGSSPDLRRTVRSSLRHGGEPFERHWRERGARPRALVLVCDVSGSMEPYARMLLAYMQACVAARRRVEAFAFGTRLTRVTRELRGRDPDAALARASAAVADWSGGTRIGDALSALNREHAARVGRGALVVVLSDGWDRGDPELLAAEMEHLRRCAYRLVWLNPLKAAADYEPLTRGMVAALPHVDRFLAGNSLASLSELAQLMEGGTT